MMAKVVELGEVLRDWARSLRIARKSPKTIVAYMAAGNQFLSFLEGEGRTTNTKALTKGDVEDFLISLEDRGMSSSTVVTRYRGLKQLFLYCEAEEILKRSPMEKMTPPKEDEPTTRHLEAEEIAALFEACEGKRFRDRRDLAIISFMVDTGVRCAELCGMTLEDVDLDRQIAIVTGKGRRTRPVHFGDQVAVNLQRYLRMRADHPRADSPSFWLSATRGAGFGDCGLELMVRRRGNAAGIKMLHPHVFRHTFAHVYRDNGGDEGTLMTLGGWRSRAMIDRYGKTGKESRALKAHAEYSPVDRMTG